MTVARPRRAGTRIEVGDTWPLGRSRRFLAKGRRPPRHGPLALPRRGRGDRGSARRVHPCSRCPRPRSRRLRTRPGPCPEPAVHGPLGGTRARRSRDRPGEPSGPSGLAGPLHTMQGGEYMEQTDAKGRIDAFVRRARAKGCVELSRVDRLAEEFGLPDDEVDALYGRLDDEGIELRDDCGQARMASMYANGGHKPRPAGRRGGGRDAGRVRAGRSPRPGGGDPPRSPPRGHPRSTAAATGASPPCPPFALRDRR